MGYTTFPYSKVHFQSSNPWGRRLAENLCFFDEWYLIGGQSKRSLMVTPTEFSIENQTSNEIKYTHKNQNLHIYSKCILFAQSSNGSDPNIRT